MNYGIKFSKGKVDIFTADIKNQQVFNSGNYVEKIKEIFEIAVTTSQDFGHGLNYTPVVIAYGTVNNVDTFCETDNYEVTLASGLNGSVIAYILFQAGS